MGTGKVIFTRATHQPRRLFPARWDGGFREGGRDFLKTRRMRSGSAQKEPDGTRNTQARPKGHFRFSGFRLPLIDSSPHQ